MARIATRQSVHIHIHIIVDDPWYKTNIKTRYDEIPIEITIIAITGR